MFDCILLKLFYRSFSFSSSIFGCSSLAVVGSLGFTGVMLFFVMLCSYLVYSSFPLIGMVGAVCDSVD